MGFEMRDRCVVCLFKFQSSWCLVFLQFLNLSPNFCSSIGVPCSLVDHFVKRSSCKGRSKGAGKQY